MRPLCATLAAIAVLSSAPLLAVSQAGCASAGQKLLTLLPGVVNDPKNRTLRREVLKLASAQFCAEMKKRGAPLKIQDDQPTMGRFYATGCDYRELDNGDAFVQFGGLGYAWTAATGRIGFRANGAIQYNPDFIVEDGQMYAYFRPRNVQNAQFQAQMVERQSLVGVAAAVVGSNLNDLANRVGTQVVSQELSRGFTVIRDGNGSIDFGLGIIEKGKRPFHPFEVHGSNKILYADDWTEVHQEQREFLGPFEIDEDNRALFLTATVDGVPAADVFVLRKDMGDAWLSEYVLRPGVTPLPGPALMTDVLPGKTEWKRTVPLAKGSYFVVIDNTSVAGTVTPPASAPSLLGPGDTPAVTRYVAQVGDAP